MDGIIAQVTDEF